MAPIPGNLAATTAIAALTIAAATAPANIAFADASQSRAVELPQTEPWSAPRLERADNFRDLAGDGYNGKDGRPVTPGILFRSNALVLSESDLATIDDIGLTAIYDLRTAAEIADAPDTPVPGAVWHHIDLVGGQTIAMPTPGGEYDGAASMIAFYERFVNEPEQRAATRDVLAAIADTDGPQLFHCTMGKDRTGWIAALLLSVAGVAHDVIVNDYLLTQAYAAKSMQHTRERLTALYGADIAALVEPLLITDVAYLEASFAQLQRDFGSIDVFLRDGLGLSDQTIMRLQDKLLGV